MSGTPWSENEMATLRAVFPAQRWPTVLESLPRRSRDAINQQARLFGVRREISKRAPWTVPEENILRHMWPVADQHELEAALPGRCWANIGRKAAFMGIRRRLPGARKNTRHIQPIVVALRRERERQGLTRPQLAEKIGYHWMQLHHWEMGKCRPIFTKLVDWADGLGMELILRPKAERVLADRPAEIPRARLMAGR